MEGARDQPPEASPLAGRIEARRETEDSQAIHGGGPPERPADAAGRRPDPPPRRTTAPRARVTTPRPKSEPPEPRLPAWLEALSAERRGAALALIADLEQAGLEEPATLAREDIEGDRPAIAEALLARRLRVVADGLGDARSGEVVRRVAEVLAEGRDPASPALPGWRLVDDRGRTMHVDPDDVER